MKRVKKKQRDRQVDEFLQKDLGEDLRESGVGVLMTSAPRQKLTSIFLDPALVSTLKEKAAKRGMRYQTMLKTIVYEHLHEY